MIAPPTPATCARTFTLPEFKHAADRTYHGTHLPRRGAYGRLWRIARCERPPSSEHRARLIWHHVLLSWVTRRQAVRDASMSSATASWYDDSTGQTASGFHAFYGVANLSLSFGTRVRFCYPTRSPRCVVAVVDDRGPYIGGRTWDLNQNVAGALGFSGVNTVGYRVGG
jgi:rare lipoprotein A (peptidoglycan hydrolase)